MQPLDRREVLRVFTATAGLSAFGQSVLAADEPPKPAGGKTMEFKIPESLKAEHEELHEELVRLTKSGGKTGDAARAVAKALHPHFVKEEELAMPPLGLLRALAEGPPRPEMAKVADLSDQLKKDLPKMLKEHEAIVGALEKLAEAGKQENHPQAGHFAEKLKMHAKTEEEVLYPAGILVGEYIKLKLGK